MLERAVGRGLGHDVGPQCPANARLLGILGPTLAANHKQVVLISSLTVASPMAVKVGYAATKAALNVIAEGFA